MVLRLDNLQRPPPVLLVRTAMHVCKKIRGSSAPQDSIALAAHNTRGLIVQPKKAKFAALGLIVNLGH